MRRDRGLRLYPRADRTVATAPVVTKRIRGILEGLCHDGIGNGMIPDAYDEEVKDLSPILYTTYWINPDGYVYDGRIAETISSETPGLN